VSATPPTPTPETDFLKADMEILNYSLSRHDYSITEIAAESAENNTCHHRLGKSASSRFINTLYIAFFILKVARFFFLEDEIIDIQTLIEDHSVEQS